jgi:hypothetical protein
VGFPVKNTEIQREHHENEHSKGKPDVKTVRHQNNKGREVKSGSRR